MYYKLLAFPGLAFSLTIHEYAHARLALAFGDPTAQQQGRVSLNPLRHLDPIGTLALFFLRFGWAKPVPVNRANLRNPGLADMIISLGGPASNFLLAILLTGVLKLVSAMGWLGLIGNEDTRTLAVNLMLYTIVINFVLCIFNLIPLYPLDGHHILRELLPWDMRSDYMRVQMRFGMFALMAIIIAPRLLPNFPSPIDIMLDRVAIPIVQWILAL
ncbi:MAG: site-2 protease family protein [Planctomycetota bacterium]